MPKISQSKRYKISEQILHYLFLVSPEAKFTSNIAEEIARDEEFARSLLEEIKKRGLILEVSKSPKGDSYTKRRRWRLSDAVYKVYQQKQTQSKSNSQALQDFSEL